MKARLAVFLLLVAAAVVIIAVLRLPVRRPGAVVRPRPQRGPAAAGAKQVVIAYLRALQKQDYRTAYAHLSARSQGAHPFDSFAQDCQKAGFPSLDVEAAQEKTSEGGGTTVVVPMVEDPATAGFTMVREKGEWKIVFVKGSPWFPYPE
jgi:hypothetical protein